MGGFEKRFGHMFADWDLLMVSALHPNHGISSFDFMASHMKEEILQTVVQEMKALIRTETDGGENSQGATEEQEDGRMDAFAGLYGAAASLHYKKSVLDLFLKQISNHVAAS